MSGFTLSAPGRYNDAHRTNRSRHPMSGLLSSALMTTTALTCISFISLASMTSPAAAQSAAPGAAIQLAPIIILAEQTLASEKLAAERLNALPGGTSLINVDSLGKSPDLTLGNALKNAPGVVVQDFFGTNDQPRLQIRGSGLQQSPVERGVLVLKDGLPLNRADGSYIIGLADPSQAKFIEVYRGYTANRLGTFILGGSLNFVSPTGSEADNTASLSVQGGSFGNFSTLAQGGTRFEAFDIYGQLGHTRSDGYRKHNTSERTNFNANLGLKLSDTIATRFFVGYTDLEFDIPGPLSQAALEQDPTQIYTGPTVTPSGGGPIITNPGPDVARDKPYRKTQQWRIGSRTSAQFAHNLFELGLSYTYTDDAFNAPIANSLKETDGGDLSASLRYAYSPNRALLPFLELTASAAYGASDRLYFQNIAGEKGAKFGDNDLSATTLSLHGAVNFALSEQLTVTPAVGFTYANRENKEQYGATTRPVFGFNPLTGAPTYAVALPQDTSYDRSYTGWSPSLGLTYALAPEQMLFAAISRSFEPPTHDDLLATINGSPFFTAGSPSSGTPREAFATPDLDAQTATTVEAGSRGRVEKIHWDATIYHSWIEDELLSLRDSSGASLASVNADKTTHFGIELGLSAQITPALKTQVTYTYQDFRFDNDATHGDNRLAGAPDHIIHAALRYCVTPELHVETELNWYPGSTPVDNANTAFADSWATLDLGADYIINDNLSLFGRATNIFDKTYASSVLVTDTAQSGQSTYLPGQGRAFYLGLKTQF